MVAFNFKKDFVPAITQGTKRSTIRKTKRCKVGDSIQLYYGQRTKHCEKIADAVCIGTAKFEITERRTINPFEQEGTVFVGQHTPLFQQEGFDRHEDLLDFFEKQYGLPFTGWLHTWELIERKKL